MAIAASDIKIRMSGGVSNTDVNLSIGGVMSTDPSGVIVTNILNNDMDDITSAEASTGIIIYHGYFYENAHGSLTYIAPKFYIDVQSLSSDSDISIIVAPEAKNTAIEVVASETTEPTGAPTWLLPANFAAGIALGDLNASDYRGFWVKYNLGSSAAAIEDTYTLGIQGDTNP